MSGPAVRDNDDEYDEEDGDDEDEDEPACTPCVLVRRLIKRIHF